MKYVQPGHDLATFRTMIIVVSVMTIFWMLLLSWVAWGAEGLPTDAPDLYDPAIVSGFERVSTAPFQPQHPCAITILRSMGYAENSHGQQHGLLFIVGYLTDAESGRIVFILETFLHLTEGQPRSYRAWIDRDYEAGKPARGDWTDLTDGITHPMLLPEARAYVQGIYQRVATAHARRHGH